MHPGIKLRHIRAFLDIAAAGNLSAVARAQGITQPALSRSLAEMEALLGAPLFARVGRGLTLTPQGAVFRGHASAALAALDAGERALRGAAGGRLAVGVLPTASTSLFPRIALRFAAVAPDTVLSVVTGPQAHLMDLLRRGEIALLMGRMPSPGEMAGLTFAHLYDEDVVLAARAGHPGAARPVREVLTTAPLILPPAGAIIRRAVDDYLAALGLPGARPVVETVALAVGRGLVLGSDAVWFISRGVILDDLERGEMIALPTGARYLAGAVGLTRRQGEAGGPADVLAEVARAEVALGAG